MHHIKKYIKHTCEKYRNKVHGYRYFIRVIVRVARIEVHTYMLQAVP